MKKKNIYRFNKWIKKHFPVCEPIKIDEYKELCLKAQSKHTSIHKLWIEQNEYLNTQIAKGISDGNINEEQGKNIQKEFFKDIPTDEKNV